MVSLVIKISFDFKSLIKGLDFKTAKKIKKREWIEDYFLQLEGYAIKQPVFSFNKFHNVNKQLGPEMKSTGESILFIDSLKDDQFYDLYSRRKMYLTK